MDKKEFYETVSKLLESESRYIAPYHGATRITRWNNRSPGNGRYEGYGLIRMFSDRFIQIDLYHPRKVNCNCSSVDQALTVIAKALEE